MTSSLSRKNCKDLDYSLFYNKRLWHEIGRLYRSMTLSKKSKTYPNLDVMDNKLKSKTEAFFILNNKILGVFGWLEKSLAHLVLSHG